MRPSPLPPRQPWYRKFHGLMPYRIREILLVSSDYDAFALEEDGPLTEQLFTEYSELHLSGAPRITHVTTMREALRLLGLRPFDLVITVARVEDGDAAAVGSLVKECHPEVPVVLLVFNEDDLQAFPGGVPAAIDRVFVWTGEARILIAVIKTIEDAKNVEPDTGAAAVQIILVVEDRMRAYSTFLGFLYPEVMEHSHSFIGDGLNDHHRLMRMRARPKILLADTYERALALFRRYQDNVLALMTDVRLPRGGREDPEAGLDLARLVRGEDAELPILFHSSEHGMKHHADELHAWFVDKNSQKSPGQVRAFLKDALGFGDFVFRLPDGREVGRARNTYEMEQALLRVSPDSLAFHAARQDFSRWLKARSMFDIAEMIRPLTLAHFDGIEQVRRYLVNVLEEARAQDQEGVITDVYAPPTGSENRFVRVSKGSIGGKARSVAFVNSMIVEHRLLDRFPGLEIRIPKTVVIGTDEFEWFMAQDGGGRVLDHDDDRAITGRFLALALRPELRRDLRAAFLALRGPLAIRSSSLLEDSRFRPFAGVYSTFMLPNNHPDPEVRFEELASAVKAVYASTFSRAARTYIAGTPHAVEDEKMAVIVQQVVGHTRGPRYYPLLSGVAQSYNYYPVGHQKAEDGVAIIALGLGEMVVSGGTALRFSPGAPEVLPQFGSAEDWLEHGQRQFYALDLARPEVDLLSGPKSSLRLHDLRLAEEDGMLTWAGSVYCAEDDVIRDDLNRPGPRLVTFNNILKHGMTPLADALSAVLRVLRDAMGGEVEIEFAMNASPLPGAGDAPKVRLYLLQLRPMASREQQELDVDIDRIPPADVLCRTDRALGHGRVQGISDVLYVRRGDAGAQQSRAVAEEIREVGGRLTADGVPFLLIGPGRWGTSDPSLGIPVDWAHIAGARAILEIPFGDRHTEPSQGSHFFHNLTAQQVGYLTITPGASAFLDRAWLDAQPAVHETDLVRHLRLAAPLEVIIDGRRGAAVVVKKTLT